MLTQVLSDDLVSNPVSGNGSIIRSKDHSAIIQTFSDYSLRPV